MASAISVKSVDKIYDNDFQALSNVDLEIKKGEIFALLGPNGAGKTTLISIICGIVTPSSGAIQVFDYDHAKDYRKAREAIGLVPQELTADAFESVWNSVCFSRGLFGKAPNPAHLEDVLKKLSLWDKKDVQLRKLSGGMKRRVMIAKALAHEPDILFLDEPTAGVDIELRKSMWEQVRALKELGVTIILTTHYIEEAEEMADRVGVISKGRIVLVEEKETLMQKMGQKELVLDLVEPLSELPDALGNYSLMLSHGGCRLTYHYNSQEEGDGAIATFLESLKPHDIHYKDLQTKQSSLEEIFVQLLENKE